jgi:hypothetical protein
MAASSNPEDKGKLRANHPAFDPRNWNYSLPAGEPLGPHKFEAEYQKRIQALLHLEFFCPAVGYTTITPEFTVVIDAQSLSGVTINDNNEPLFASDTDLVLKSAKPIYEADSQPQVGGYISFRRVAGSRGLPLRGLVPKDRLYFDGATGSVHAGIMNLDLVSDFFTVRADQPLSFRSEQAQPIMIKIYDTHDYVGKTPIQTIYFNFPEANAPVPDLVVQPSMRVEWINQDDGIINRHPAVQAPRWWAFHQQGVLSRGPDTRGIVLGRFAEMGGRSNLDGDTARYGGPLAEGLPKPIRGRQAYPGSRALIYGKEEVTNYRDVERLDNNDGTPPEDLRALRIAFDGSEAGKYNMLSEHFGSDVVRSIQPGHGDPRLIAGKSVVETSEWSPHVLYNSSRAFLAHNFSSYRAGSEPGFDRSGDATVLTEDPERRILPNSVNVSGDLVPDAPYSGRATDGENNTTQSLPPAFLARRYFDFDDSDPGGRVGPYINKADEGNYFVGGFKPSGWDVLKIWRASYFRTGSTGARSSPGAPSLFTPNRMMSSPVMMGSLPSRMFFSNPIGKDASQNGNGAWTNLLFRPHVQVVGAEPSHPGAETPPDHYLLDLFWMPIVEPYAISEPLSTAGKVNMNYQMMPFTHIRRATAMHAVMKAEMFAALPSADHSRARGVRRNFTAKGQNAPIFHEETLSHGQAAARWHRSIAIDRLNNESGNADNAWWNVPANARVQATLRQFEERFNFSGNATGTGGSGIGGPAGGLPQGFRGGLFRSASQICEMHLIPSRVSTANAANGNGNILAVNNATANINPTSLTSYNGRETAMRNFWTNHCSTGDNTRERPYSNLYAKLTTRSNTFRVHVRAQSILKAKRGPNPRGFDASQDEITGEFRGSFLLERYIDQADLEAAGTKVDFTVGNPLDETNHPPLDSYYRFRVLESKRFAP